MPENYNHELVRRLKLEINPFLNKGIINKKGMNYFADVKYKYGSLFLKWSRIYKKPIKKIIVQIKHAVNYVGKILNKIFKIFLDLESRKQT
ncbi:MAG: hypothetical protein JWM09_593 [Francisellaceae bacterium]|nr:hypothetical protein [Francisellaceae bacterium]